MHYLDVPPVPVLPDPHVRAAIVHDWLTGMRGGEAVLEAMIDVLPSAEIYTLFCFPDRVSPRIRARPIHTSFLQRLPMARRYYRHYLPLFPVAIESFDLRAYDLVVSSSHCVAKGVITRTDAVHVAYIHTPMRYVWDAENDYFANGRLGFAARAAVAMTLPALRRWDELSSLRPDHFIANSRTVAARIRKRYRREAVVIHPPVDTDRFAPSDGPPGDYYLCVSALVPYKRIDLAIRACTTAGLTLHVVGEGSERPALERLAGPTVRFLGRIDDEALAREYAGCRALLFPGEEDFGIVPLEAMASGRPVVAFGRGGASETMTPETGIVFSEPTAQSLARAIRTLEDRRAACEFSSDALREHALGFDRRVFVDRFQRFISDAVGPGPGR